MTPIVGSWGDNELSPECLDGAQRFLVDGGISIPANYTSWLAPLSSQTLYNKARESVGTESLYVGALRVHADDASCGTL